MGVLGGGEWGQNVQGTGIIRLWLLKDQGAGSKKKVWNTGDKDNLGSREQGAECKIFNGARSKGRAPLAEPQCLRLGRR